MKNICVAVLENNRKYLLQLRDNKKNIYEYNRWGFFGGQKKQSETPLECIKREIYEELSYDLKKPTYIGKIFNSEFLIHIFHKKIRKKKFIVKEGRDYNYFIKDKIFKKKCKSLKIGKEFLVSKSSFKVFKYFMETR